MRLAMVQNGEVQCLLCSWRYKAPTKKRKRLGQAEELTLVQRLKLLEENILSHLRYGHDRLLLTKEETLPEEEGLMGRIYYNGRRPERVRF